MKTVKEMNKYTQLLEIYKTAEVLFNKGLSSMNAVRVGHYKGGGCDVYEGGGYVKVRPASGPGNTKTIAVSLKGTGYGSMWRLPMFHGMSLEQMANHLEGLIDVEIQNELNQEGY
jgi:hypothetical protein